MTVFQSLLSSSDQSLQKGPMRSQYQRLLTDWTTGSTLNEPHERQDTVSPYDKG
jgi:hypothetical protein